MTLVNGEPTQCLDAADRGLQYGDGVFETLAVRDGIPAHWDRHMARLREGCARLGIEPPAPELLRREAHQECGASARGVLKLIVTRGSGGRGYRIPVPSRPARILSLHPWPDYPSDWQCDGIAMRVCVTRWSLNPALAGIKHLNRLEQVLARSEWDNPDIAEGLMLNSRGQVISGTMTNIFVVQDDALITPDLAECGICGITRARVLEAAADLGMDCRVLPLDLEQLLRARELFVCNSVAGIWPVRKLEQVSFAAGSATRQLTQALESRSS
ncbi:MAG: aminodeoxychorismate lyase [Gammaproteobacteria bacterium]